MFLRNILQPENDGSVVEATTSKYCSSPSDCHENTWYSIGKPMYSDVVFMDGKGKKKDPFLQ